MSQKATKINPNQPVTYKKHKKPRILVAPLDWGLGHATRCIPIIRELLEQDCEVWLAGEGIQEELLKTEFPELPFLHLPGYNVHYAKTKRGLPWRIIRQSRKLLVAFQSENLWLKKVVPEYSFDAIISDNRFGLFHEAIPSVFITHQLLIKTFTGKWTEKVLQKINYKYINRFTECWVPDIETENSLAGELSHPDKKPKIPVRYIGLLSRFEKKETVIQQNHLLIILSGPEPQRTMLEEKIIKEVSNYNGTATIVRGLPGSTTLIPSTNMIQLFNHLPAIKLNEEMLKAEYVISRSGYSTVMDIMNLQKKSILIPTPGQTEQEYLARYYRKNNMAYIAGQKDFSLVDSIEKAKQFPYHLPSIPPGKKLHTVMQQFLSTLK